MSAADTAAPAAAPAAAPMDHRHVLRALSGLLIVLFVAMISSTVVSVALPQIIGSLEGTQSQYTWVVTATLLASTASTPIWGKLADLFSKKLLLRYPSGSSSSRPSRAGSPSPPSSSSPSAPFRGSAWARSGARPGDHRRDDQPEGARTLQRLPRRRRMAVATVGGPLLVRFHHRRLLARLALVLLHRRALHAPRLSDARPHPAPRRGPPARHQGRLPRGLAHRRRGQPPAPLGHLRRRRLRLDLLAERTDGRRECRHSRGGRPRRGARQGARRSAARRPPSRPRPRHRRQPRGRHGHVRGAVFLGQYFQIGRGYSPTEAGLLTIPLMAGVLVSSTVAGRLVSRTGKVKPFIVAGVVVLALGFLGLSFIDHETSARDGVAGDARRGRRGRYVDAEPGARPPEHRAAQRDRRGQRAITPSAPSAAPWARLRPRRGPRPPGVHEDHGRAGEARHRPRRLRLGRLHPQRRRHAAPGPGRRPAAYEGTPPATSSSSRPGSP